VANGRLYLICQKCDARKVLFKWWGDGAELPAPEYLELWATEHMLECHGAPFAMDGTHFRVEGE
jgi:hypothetical protein